MKMTFFSNMSEKAYLTAKSQRKSDDLATLASDAWTASHGFSIMSKRVYLGVSTKALRGMQRLFKNRDIYISPSDHMMVITTRKTLNRS